MSSSSASERQPLLSDVEAGSKFDNANSKGLVKREIRILAKYAELLGAAPVILAQFLHSSLSMVPIISVGHLGKLELSAAATAILTFNILVLSTISGFAFCLDTLCSQAWTSHHPELMGLHVQRATLVICSALVLPIIAIWNIEPFFLLLKQDPRVAELAGQFLKVSCAGIPGFIIYEVVKKWLQNQGELQAPTYILLVIAPLNAALNYALVWSSRAGIGFLGAALATAISINLMGILFLAYCYLFVSRKGWCGFQRAALTGWGPAFKLGLAGLAIDSSEWVAFEIIGLSSSFVGTTALATHSVLGSTAALFYRPYQAVGTAGAIRVGNCLGAGDGLGASVCTKVCLYGALGLGILGSFLLYALRGVIPGAFSSDADVIALTIKTMPIVCGYQIIDSFKTISVGLLFGSGRTLGGALYLNISYYLIGMPAAFLLAFRAELGLAGLWLGLGVGLLFSCILLTRHVLATDWDIEVARANERNLKAQEGRIKADQEADEMLQHQHHA